MFVSLCLMIMLAISMMTILSMRPQEKDAAPQELSTPITISYTLHAPIFINGNGGFIVGTNGVTGGSGTESDPFIIEDWSIDASFTDGIRMENADVHFIIRNCRIYNAALRGYHIGIYLDNFEMEC